MKTRTLLVLFFLCATFVNAQTYFDYNDIRYRVIKEADGENAYGTVSVAPPEFGSYKGNIVIPNVVKESKDRYADSYKVVAIDNNAFEGTEKLVSINFPPTIEKIGEEAFWGSSVSEVIIPAGNRKEIGSDAFKACRSLKKIELPPTVKAIQSRAFAYCSALEYITIPGVTKIGIGAFEYCHSLEEIQLPEPLQYIDDYAFSKCVKLNKVVCNDKLKRIGECAFSECAELTTIDLPESVREIGKAAFLKSGIKAFKFPNKIEVIREGTFSLSKLQTVTFPSELEEIEVYAFAYLNMDEFEIPANIKIHPMAFYQMKYVDKKARQKLIDEIKKIKKPTIVKMESATQNSFVWKGCLFEVNGIVKPEDEFGFVSLNETDKEKVEGDLIIPEIFEVLYKGNAQKYIVEGMDNHAFYNCTKLQSVVLPMTCQRIPSFYKCANLQSVIIPQNGKIKSVPSGIFADCKSLRTITLPQGITKIESSAFANSGIEEVVIPEGVDTIGETAFEDCQLKKVILPTSLKIIQYRAFSGNNNLKQIKLPKNLETIEKRALGNCPFDTIVIPTSVKMVGSGAFFAAKNIIIEGNPEKWGDFYNSKAIQSIHINDDKYLDTYALRNAPHGVVISPRTYALKKQKEDDARLLASIDRNKKVFNSKEDVLNFLRSHIFVWEEDEYWTQYFTVRFTKICYNYPSDGGYDIAKYEVVSFTKTSAQFNFYFSPNSTPVECVIQVKGSEVIYIERYRGETRIFKAIDMP